MNNISGITVVAIQDRVPYDKYIGRAFGGFAASEWANPYKVGRDGTGEEVLAKYEAHVRNSPLLMKKILTLQKRAEAKQLSLL